MPTFTKPAFILSLLATVAVVGSAHATLTQCDAFSWTADIKCPSGFSNPFYGRGYGDFTTLPGFAGQFKRLNVIEGTAQGHQNARAFGIKQDGSPTSPFCDITSSDGLLKQSVGNCQTAVRFRMLVSRL